MSVFHSSRILENNVLTIILIYFAIYAISTYVIASTIKTLELTKLVFTNISYFLYLNRHVRLYYAIAIIGLLGVPPVSGFVIKFSILLLFLLKNNSLIYLIFFSYVLISVYFYTQVLKLSIVNTYTKQFLTKYHKNCLVISYKYSILITFFSFINIFFILFIKDIIIFLN